MRNKIYLVFLVVLVGSFLFSGNLFAQKGKFEIQGIKRMHRTPNAVTFQVQYYIPPRYRAACYIGAEIVGTTKWSYKPAGRKPNGVRKGQVHFTHNVVVGLNYTGTGEFKAKYIKVKIYDAKKTLASTNIKWGRTWGKKPMKYSIYGIRMSPNSPASLNYNQKVKIAFKYTSKRPNVYIWARPMTGNNTSPGYAASGSKLYTSKEGSGNQDFTFKSGNVKVDRVRFQIFDKTKKKLLFEKFVRASYKYPKVVAKYSIYGIRMSPNSPASLNYNQKVNIAFKYTSKIPNVYIWARPMTGNNTSPGYAASGSKLYTAVKGSGNQDFTFKSGNVKVDRVRFQIFDKTKKKLLFEKFIRANYKYPKVVSGNTNQVKLPDLLFGNVTLIDGCGIRITIKNKGKAGVPASYYNLPKAVSVQMYNNGKPWGGLILKGIDPKGILKSPGGVVHHIWFPNAQNLKLKPGKHNIKVVVDSNNVLKEYNENNNVKKTTLNCKSATAVQPGTNSGVRTIPNATIPTQTIGTIPVIKEKAPQRFFLDFNGAYLVYVPSSKTLQIAAERNVLSYGSDWQKANIYPYLYHLRLKTWKGFYWQINTSRKEAYLVKGPNFGKIGVGSKTKINNITVDVVGGSSSTAPTRFLLKFKKSYLVFVPSSKTLQIIAGNNVLTYGSDWKTCKLKPYLYQFKQNIWKNFHWQVNTSQKIVEKISGGRFCKIVSASRTKLNIGVRVVK